jgi:hypothetical protein
VTTKGLFGARPEGRLNGGSLISARAFRLASDRFSNRDGLRTWVARTTPGIQSIIFFFFSSRVRPWVTFFLFAFSFHTLSSMPALLAKRDPIPFSFTRSYNSGPFDEEGKIGWKIRDKI